MRAVAVAVLGSLVGLVPGQLVPGAPVPVRAEVCRYVDVRALDRYDDGLDVATTPMRRAPARFADVMSRWWCDRDPTSRPRPVGVTGSTLHAHGAAEMVKATQQALAQMHGDEVVRARMQYSVLALPQAAVAAEGLKPGTAVEADEAILTRLARAAVGQGGNLRNLPEVVAAPLRPFVVEDARADGAEPLRLRAEMVPLGRAEALLGLHVVRGALPANLASVPDAGKTLLASPVLRLTAGGLVLMTLREGDTTTLLAVRCVEIGPAVVEPKSQPAAPPSRRQ